MHRNPVGVLGGRCAFLKTVTVKLAEKISLSSSATFSLVVWDGMSDAAVWDSGAGSALSQKEVTVGLYPGQVKVLCYLSDAALAKLNFAGCKRAPRISPVDAPPPSQGGKREPGCRESSSLPAQRVLDSFEASRSDHKAACDSFPRIDTAALPGRGCPRPQSRD